MARAELAIEPARFGHGEEHACALDLQIADDHRAVVQLVHRLRVEERDEQLASHGRAHLHALAARELEQVGVLLEGDDRADAVARELGHRGDDLVDDARLLELAAAAEPGAPTHAHERAPDVVLEDDDHHEDDRREHVLQQAQQRDELEDVRRRIEQEDDAEAEAHLHRARAAHREQEAVDDVGDDEDVDRVAQELGRGAAGEDAVEHVKHVHPPRGSHRVWWRPQASASRSSARRR